MRAVLYLTSVEDSQKYVPIRDIAAQLDLSFPFLSKILQDLSAKNIVTSYRGPNGGVALARSPKDISMWDVVTAIDGESFCDGCLFDLPECVDCDTCVLNTPWRKVSNRIRKSFQQKSLEALSKNYCKAKKTNQ
jgi:Rrf2 family protein